MSSIYKKREKLYQESILLRDEAGKTDNYLKSADMRKKQDELYKRWKFYNNIIKAKDKIK